MHTDTWRTPKLPRLPSFMKRMSTVITNAFYRMLGYGRKLARAEKELLKN